MQFSGAIMCSIKERLSLAITLGLRKAQAIIMSWAVLHNISIDFYGDVEPCVDPEIPADYDREIVNSNETVLR